MIDVKNAHGFDFHCHVDLDREPARLIARCESERIVTVAVTTTPKAWPQNRQWAEKSTFIVPALGLHPELVAGRHTEIELFEALAGEARFFGEVGLDGSPPHRGSMPNQKHIFERVLKVAQRLGGRVITIHSRAAASEVIEAVETHTSPDRVRCILHWFSGTPAAARRAAENGCYFSINSQMLTHDRGRKLVKSLPLERVLTETDAPFSLVESRPAAPWDVQNTAQILAGLFGVSVKRIEEKLAETARDLLTFAQVA